MSFRTIEWQDDTVVMIDQTRLPGEEIYNTYTDFQVGRRSDQRYDHPRGAGHRCGGRHGNCAGGSGDHRRYPRILFPPAGECLRRPGPHPTDGGQPVLGHRAHEAGGRGQSRQKAGPDSRRFSKKRPSGSSRRT